MKLELSPEEHEELIRIIDSYSSELRVEIRRTDEHGFRELLKKEQNLLSGILQKMKEGPSDEEPRFDG